MLRLTLIKSSETPTITSLLSAVATVRATIRGYEAVENYYEIVQIIPHALHVS